MVIFKTPTSQVKKIAFKSNFCLVLNCKNVLFLKRLKKGGRKYTTIVSYYYRGGGIKNGGHFTEVHLRGNLFIT